jgi:hypothetical protein
MAQNVQNIDTFFEYVDGDAIFTLDNGFSLKSA